MDKTYKIAIVVDMQHDFYAEDGTLKVEGGQKAVENAVKKLKDTDYDVICFTADFHPCNHSSFVENGGTCQSIVSHIHEVLTFLWICLKQHIPTQVLNLLKFLKREKKRTRKNIHSWIIEQTK